MLTAQKPLESDIPPAPLPTAAGFASASPISVPPRTPATPSVLSADLTITGNIKTEGEVRVEGTVEGDIRAAHLTVGESARINGEVVAEEVVVNGHVAGRLRGLKVRLSASARVEGDIIHKTIAIENGAHFEGSVQRHDDPVGDGQGRPARAPR